MQYVYIFEDNQYAKLFPLVFARAVFELRCGMFSALERTSRQYPHATITLFCRNFLSDVMRERYSCHINSLHSTDDMCLFLNGRALLSSPISTEGPDEIGIQDDTVVYARITGKNAKRLSPEMFLSDNPVGIFPSSVRTVPIQASVIHYFWDLIKHNTSQIEKDYQLFVKKGAVLGRVYNGVYFVNEDQIYLGTDSRIKPGCVFDAEEGPIYVGNHVTIAPNTTVEGPVFIGNSAIVQSNTRLRRGSNIGEACKVGGEIVNTIFHSYTNKQHDGFIGDSYVGSWVNMGADTVNSNLLNTYGNIKVETEGNIVNTNHMFLGMAMGDHTKTAVNTTIMTGSVFGFACNIITPSYPPKYLPSFTWYSQQGMVVCNLEKALHLAKVVMKRRNKEMTPAEELLFRGVFELTSKERHSLPN